MFTVVLLNMQEFKEKMKLNKIYVKHLTILKKKNNMLTKDRIRDIYTKKKKKKKRQRERARARGRKTETRQTLVDQ